MAVGKVPDKMTLQEYIAKHLSTPFEYGKHDCIIFTVGWIEIATGKKYLPKVTWSTEEKAVAELKKRGGIEAIFDGHFDRVECNYAVDGDISVVNGTASIFSGAHCVSTGTVGASFTDRTLATAAWRIPCQK
jgi:hypothetical protein